MSKSERKADRGAYLDGEVERYAQKKKTVTVVSATSIGMEVCHGKFNCYRHSPQCRYIRAHQNHLDKKLWIQRELMTIQDTVA